MLGTIQNERYQVDRHIARNGHEIYAATDLTTGQPVRLDRYFLQQDEHEDFNATAHNARALIHPALRIPLNSWTSDYYGHIIYSWSDGDSLKRKLPDLISLAPAAKCHFLQQAAQATIVLLNAKLLRDSFRPADIWLDANNAPFIETFCWPRLLLLDPAVRNAQSIDPTYSPPEIATGSDKDESTFTYMYVVLAYQLFTANQLPYPMPDDSQQMVQALINRLQTRVNPTPIRQFAPDLPAPVDDIFAKALADDLAQRYPTFSAFINTLRNAFGIPPDS
jgi:serine/threonine-protein kinase